MRLVQVCADWITHPFFLSFNFHMATKHFMSLQENKINSLWGKHYIPPYKTPLEKLFFSKYWLWKISFKTDEVSFLSGTPPYTDPFLIVWTCILPSAPDAPSLASIPALPLSISLPLDHKLLEGNANVLFYLLCSYSAQGKAHGKDLVCSEWMENPQATGTLWKVWEWTEYLL